MYRRNIILTPDSDGNINQNIDQKFGVDLNIIFPVNLYLEKKITNNNIKFLSKSVENKNDILELKNQIADSSKNISNKIVNYLKKNQVDDEILQNVFLDYTRYFLEIYVDRAFKLKETNEFFKSDYEIFPKKNNYYINNSKLIKNFVYEIGYLNQNFQWYLFRSILGCKDILKRKEENIIFKIFNYLKIKIKFNKKLYNKPIYLFGPKLKRLEDFNNLQIFKNDYPKKLINLLPYNKTKRKKIASIIFNELNLKFNNFNLDNSNLKGFCKLVSKIFPNEIVENFNFNYDLYYKFIFSNRMFIRGFVSYAPNSKDFLRESFISAVCLKLNIPIINFQHSGIIGYDIKNCNFYIRDMMIKSIYHSAGWSKFPKEYLNKNIKADIKPFPNPYFSLVKKNSKHLITYNSNTYLIPISKSHTLDDKLGLEINSHNIVDVRNITFKIIEFLVANKNNVILIYRNDFFDKDLLYSKLLNENLLNNIRIFSNKDYKPIELFPKVDGVIWDSVSTGFLESLTYGIPTISFSTNQFSEESDFYFDLLKKENIILHDPELISKTINKFAKNYNLWLSTKNKISPFLNQYALTDNNYLEIWEKYLKLH